MCFLIIIVYKRMNSSTGKTIKENGRLKRKKNKGTYLPVKSESNSFFGSPLSFSQTDISK